MSTPTISPQDAQEALQLIDQTRQHMRHAFSVAGGAFYLILWGAIWLLGSLGSAFLPPAWAGTLWMLLAGAGTIASFAAGARFGQKVRSEIGKRIALFWLLLLAFSALIIALTAPADERLTTLLLILFPMFGYMVMGLWMWPVMLWAGLAVSVLALGGYWLFLQPQYFALWVGILGGGTLLGSGFYLQRTGGNHDGLR